MAREYTQQVLIRITDEQWDRLSARAKRRGLSLSQAARELITGISEKTGEAIQQRKVK